MTDSELLELAAKAAGVDPRELSSATRTTSGFHPLTHDGDAFRLAVKLRMRVATPTSHDDCAIAGRGDVRGVHVKAYSEDEVTDPYAATRRAIVRAAAEIGKALP